MNLCTATSQLTDSPVPFRNRCIVLLYMTRYYCYCCPLYLPPPPPPARPAGKREKGAASRPESSSPDSDVRGRGDVKPPRRPLRGRRRDPRDPQGGRREGARDRRHRHGPLHGNGGRDRAGVAAAATVHSCKRGGGCFVDGGIGEGRGGGAGRGVDVFISQRRPCHVVTQQSNLCPRTLARGLGFVRHNVRM